MYLQISRSPTTKSSGESREMLGKAAKLEGDVGENQDRQKRLSP